MKQQKDLIHEELFHEVNKLDAPDELKNSMLYSLQAGGKRIRPLLMIATFEAFQTDSKKAIKAACSIEMIHTYSLIHDDLPSMDNDDLRRGKPTNHKVFGEALAILAGDGLLTQSFQLLAEMSEVGDAEKIRLIHYLAKSAGPQGMVGGQVADMEGENKSLTLEELMYIHQNKTGRLLAFSVVSAAIISGATDEIIEIFEQFAFHLGLAFQIQDDILDLEGTVDKIGKPVGSDHHNKKSTYPGLLGMTGAKEKLAHHTLTAKDLLRQTELKADLLMNIVDLIAERDH
ncbi:polyprenyl synthetase family protein [Bacillus sp. 2205SS5-2]|uniref:polyprenyl synthetase family protein n=1 Tax=Bacillus sp. 2205SS5-2 TaxID=3109031 RepID=UPI003FA580CC